VSDVKTFIDGMRSSRDEKMKGMSSLKDQLREQNERLIKVTQEKAHMEAKNRATAEKVADGNSEQLTEFQIRKNEKEKDVIKLREEWEAVKEKENAVRGRFDDVKVTLQTHRDELERVIEACRLLYDAFDEKRRDCKAEKSKRQRELTDPDHAWDAPVAAAAEVSAHASIVVDAAASIRYVAMFPYESEKEDELTFQEGDVIMVSFNISWATNAKNNVSCHCTQINPNQASDPGWLGGELNGKVGWFPESYVQKEDEVAAAAKPVAAEADSDAVPAAEPVAVEQVNIV
jgi:hypothetical protein